MLFLKKLLSRFFFPLPLCAELLVAGLLLWTFTKWKRTGRGLVIAGTVLLVLFGHGWGFESMLRSLEVRYDPVSARTEYATVARGGVRATEMQGQQCYVAVLGQSVSADTNLPANLRFNELLTQRLVEAVRLERLVPAATMLVSIADVTLAAEEKERVLREFLAVCGLTTNAVRVLADARDTAEEIAWFKSVAGTNRVFLVSCASHLPRAMVLAERAGLNAVPSPSGFLVGRQVERKERPPFSPAELFPDARSLNVSERAVYEWMGLAWEKARP